jgi:PHP domain
MIGVDPYVAGGYKVLKVETHLHTLHSDGQHGVSAMLEACKSAGYDAVALTDHNTLSGLHEATVAAERLGLILLLGVEVTTFRGHAVALGVVSVPEWRDLEQRGMDALADDVHAEGGLLCVAHPAALGSPICSGCAWAWPVQPASVDLWEVFSAERPSSEIPAELWRQLVAAGGHASPVAAGDVHSTSAAARLKTATYVYASERSPAAVLEALRGGRVFASAGPRLDFWLENGAGNIALVGSHVTPGHWTPRLSGPGFVREVELGRGRCLYAERRAADQRLEAISAPIWIESSH